MATAQKSKELNHQPLEARERRKRKREWIAILVLTAVFIGLTVAEFRLSRVSKTLPFVNSIFFFGLLNVNLLILSALAWLVFRNIGKLIIERRRKILGSRLKTKLVLAFLGFSVIPTLALFAISAMYINSSFDKWFSIRVQNTFQASLEITGTYYRNSEQTARHFAEHLAKGIGNRLGAKDIASSGYVHEVPDWTRKYLEAQRDLLALDGVEYYADPLEERLIFQRAPVPDLQIQYPRLPLESLDKAFGGEHASVMQHLGSGDLIRCLVPVYEGGRANGAAAGVLVVDTYIPVSLVNKVDEIASVLDDYRETNPLKYPMKTMYLVILILITLVILFVAIWIGLYMARELTEPVERLVHGAQAVGAGNLDITITSRGHDEIAVLVDSFNKMTQDLRENRARLTEATVETEKRRLQLEAVLANIGTGVIVVGRKGEITTFNRALSHLLEMDPNLVLGRRYTEALGGEETEQVRDLIFRAFQNTRGAESGAESEPSQLAFRTQAGQLKNLAAVATVLRDSPGSPPWGVVVVIDDMTYLIKGQREMAWREVARRIAHEIKNPLTPIKLSAQRLQRRLTSYPGREASLLKECTDTIIKHTDELKEMVNEFSNFARFPEASPAPHDLNEAVREVVSLYQPGHPEIGFRFEAEPKLPVFEFDRDQIKRVLINLLDNAVSALTAVTQGNARNIRLETHYNEQLQIAVIEVSDTGPGITEEIRERMFEPYFSTKTEGTGLGLAIAKRIVNDHDGFIRVQSDPGQGTTFVIELPTTQKNLFKNRDLRGDSRSTPA